jgi:hemerythrin-like metal-binding protein
MDLFTWKKDLDLGVSAMDREHRELVAAMNAIHALHAEGAPKAKVDAAFVRLITLTKQHFADEEKHMAAISFPGLKVHARIHADMLAKVAAHYQRFQKGDGYLPPEFFDFLVLWLGAHIQGIDRKYAEHRAPAKI